MVALGTLIGAAAGDTGLGFRIGHALATVTWMAAAAWLLLRGLERSRDADLTLRTGLLLSGISVAKLFLFDFSALSGIVRSVAFIVTGLLLLATASRYAKAYQRSRTSCVTRRAGGTWPMDALRGRWRADCAAVAPGAERPQPSTTSAPTCCARWHEPHRRYHDTTHLAEVLAAVDVLRRRPSTGPSKPSRRGAGRLVPRRGVRRAAGDRQRGRSAALAARQLGRLGADRSVVARVVAVVLDTASHDLAPRRPRPCSRRRARRRPVGALSAGGAVRRVLRAGARGVRSTCPQPRYATARSEVLRPFLVRDARLPHGTRAGGVGAGRAREPRARAHPPRGLSTAAASGHQNWCEQRWANSSQVTQRRSDVSSSSGASGGRRPWTRTS